MSSVVLLLDTNILWKRDLCTRLTEKIKQGDLRVCIPTLVHAERIRQVADQYGQKFAINTVRQYIEDAQFELLPLTTQDAEAIAEIWLELKTKGMTEDYWKKHRFDIVLCAIARSTGFTLVVDDKGRHFKLIANRMRITNLTAWLETF